MRSLFLAFFPHYTTRLPRRGTSAVRLLRRETFIRGDRRAGCLRSSGQGIVPLHVGMGRDTPFNSVSVADKGLTLALLACAGLKPGATSVSRRVCRRRRGGIRGRSGRGCGRVAWGVVTAALDWWVAWFVLG